MKTTASGVPITKRLFESVTAINIATGERRDVPEAEARKIMQAATTDPDLIAARDIVKATLDPDSHKRCHCRDEIDAGRWDRGQKVRATLAGIRYGRAQRRIGGTTP